MAEIGYATLGVIPSFDGFERKLSSGVNGPMSKVGGTSGAAFGDAAGKTAGSRFGSVFKNAAKAGLVGVAALGVGAFKVGKDSIEEARDAAKVTAQTGAVLKSTGKAANVTGKHVGDLSGKLSLMAGVDDELIQSGANVLLTFTKIRNEAGKGNSVFDQATLATLNMSAALKTDMSSAAIQVGKALNDPVKGMSALGRAGIQFTEDQQEQVEHLVKTGDQLRAQKIILGELDTQFRGSARSQADSSDKLTVAFGNIQESIGTALLPAVDDFSRFMLKKGVPAGERFSDFLNDEGIPAVKKFAGWAKDELVPALDEAVDVLKPAARFAGDMVGAFNDLPDGLKKGLLGGALLGGAALKLGGLGGGRGGALGTAGSMLGIGKPVPVFVTNPGGIGGGVGGATGGKGGKLGSILGPLKYAGPAIAYTVAFEFQDKFPEFAPFGDKGFLPGAPKEGHGWLSWFQDDDSPKKIDAIVDSTDRFKGALDLVGAKKINPDLRIPNIMNEQNRLASFSSKMDLVGSAKIRPHVEVTGIAHARAEVDGLADALAGVATNASNALDAAGQTVIDAVGGRGRNGPRPRDHGRDRQRSRNLGGIGGGP